MKHFLVVPLLFLSLLFLSSTATAQIKPYDLRLEHLTAPLGIDELQPRFSWKLKSNVNGQTQSAYQITVRKVLPVNVKDDSIVWDSGKVSGQSQFVEYRGKLLKPQTTYSWTVTVFDKAGKAQTATSSFSTGIFDNHSGTDGWKGKWIGLDSVSLEEATTDSTKLTLDDAVWIWTTENAQRSAPSGKATFRKTFDIPAGMKISQAEFAFTADNEFTAYLNGTEIGHGMNFHIATVINVTKTVKPGRNVLSFHAVNHGDAPNPAGLLGVLRIQPEQGDAVLVKTDNTWKGIDGWEEKYAQVDCDDTAWKNAVKTADFSQESVQTNVERPSPPARYLVKDWKPKAKVASATVYIAGLGYYELQYGGIKIGDHRLDPVLTDYDKRVPYVTYNVDPKIFERSNTNEFCVTLGNGRYYAPRLTDPAPTRTFGYPKMLFQLEVQYRDGSTETVVSDETWGLVTDGPIRDNNDYDGEIFDARKKLSPPTRKAEIVEAPKGKLVAQMMPPMRVLEEVNPLSVTEIKPGVWIYDFGVNLVGSPRFKPLAGQPRRPLFNRRTAANSTSLPEGAEFVLRFAETLIPEGPHKGELYTANLRGAMCRDIYIADGHERTETEYAPAFTYHGFRYAELTVRNVPEDFTYKPNKETLTARWINTDLPIIGKFRTSNETINSIFKIVVNGTRGNYLSIPTDCPQRDERQGWQGDRAGESLGEMMMFDGVSLYSKWLIDIEDSQRNDGNLSDVCPNFWSFYGSNVTWPSAFTIIPQSIYTLYGDKRPIERHYEGMKRWLIGYLGQFVQEGIIDKDNYGDWCVPPEKPELIHSEDPARKTSKAILATAYYIHNLDLLTQCAHMLGKQDEADDFAQKAAVMRKAFNDKFLNRETGKYDNGTQTSCVLPLYFNIVPDDMRTKVFSTLVNNIENVTNRHIGTGLIGGQWLNRVLTEFGRADLSYVFTTNTSYPSWGYMVQQGATTVWELWNGNTADPAMNSGNHVMLVGDLIIWYYETLAGIKTDPAKPGFEHIIMKPQMISSLTFVDAEINTVKGLVRSSWKVSGKRFRWDITIPVGSTATVYLPDGTKQENVVSGKHSLECTLP
jgi:alpha-L-rhamnosidase